MGTFLGNTREILNQKVAAVIRRKSSDTLHPRATQCFIEAIRGRVQIQTAKWDAVRVHQMLGAITASIQQGRPVEPGIPGADVNPGEA